MSDIRNREHFSCRWPRRWKRIGFGALKIQQSARVVFAGYWFLVSGFWYLAGCAEIQAPTAKEALTHPFGTQPPFQRGTTKEKVRASWGEPDQVVLLGADELGNPREKWVYTGRIPNLPVDYQYVSRTKHLFFEGENLVRWETEEKGAGSL